MDLRIGKMAEQELKKISQEELDEILKQHKLWVESNKQDGTHADLSFHDLRTLEFPTRTMLWGANLKHTNLQGTNLEGADLRKANLEGAILISANLREANLMRANLKKVNFRRAELCNAQLVRTALLEADLRGANLEGAKLAGAKLAGAKLEGAKLMGADFRQDTFVQYLEDEHNIYYDTDPVEQATQYYLKINKLEQELHKARTENNQSQEQQEKIAKLEQELQQAKQAKQELEQVKQISKAHDALTTALTNTETQIEKHKEFSSVLEGWALTLIVLDVIYIIFAPSFMISNPKFYDLIANKVGMWGILFLTFPALLILLIALALLRHQKQLIAEIRHYSMLKHKIELYGGILKAAQFIAFAQNSEEDNFIKNTFNEIKTELLKSPNFDLNAQPHIFPEEGGNLLEMLKSTTELVKASTETSKAAAEIVKKATTSEK